MSALSLVPALTLVLLALACAVDPSPVPTNTSAPTHTPAPSPTSRVSDQEMQKFISQQTKVAPTMQSAGSVAADLVNVEGRYRQWILWTTAYPPEVVASSGLAGNRSVRTTSDGKVQQYTCSVYPDGLEVPRINIYYQKELQYTVVTNDAGERQGAIRATTTINGTPVPLEWRTWASRADRIRLRGDEALTLAREIREKRLAAFMVSLADNPELSGTFSVADLVDAMATNGMKCFE